MDVNIEPWINLDIALSTSKGAHTVVLFFFWFLFFDANLLFIPPTNYLSQD